jgi:hypothetical protein
MVKIKETQESRPKTVKEMPMKKIPWGPTATMTKLSPSLIISLVMITEKEDRPGLKKEG